MGEEKRVAIKPERAACKAPTKKGSRKVSFAPDVEIIGGRASSVSFAEEVEVIGVSDGSDEDEDEGGVLIDMDDADVLTPSDNETEEPDFEELDNLFAEARDAVAPLPVILPPRSSSLHWRRHRRNPHVTALPQSPPPPYMYYVVEGELEHAERYAPHVQAPAYSDDESPPTYATAMVDGQEAEEEGGDIVLEDAVQQIMRWFFRRG